MRWLSTVLLVILCSAMASAQESAFRFAAQPYVGSAANSEDAPADSTEANDSSSYESYENAPAVSLLQKKAMFKAEQRLLRIASRKWYGYSQSRPVVLANPYMNHYRPLSPYSTRWIGGRSSRPNWYWSGNGWY